MHRRSVSTFLTSLALNRYTAVAGISYGKSSIGSSNFNRNRQIPFHEISLKYSKLMAAIILFKHQCVNIIVTLWLRHNMRWGEVCSKFLWTMQTPPMSFCEKQSLKIESSYRSPNCIKFLHHGLISNICDTVARSAWMCFSLEFIKWMKHSPCLLTSLCSPDKLFILLLSFLDVTPENNIANMLTLPTIRQQIYPWLGRR